MQILGGKGGEYGKIEGNERASGNTSTNATRNVNVTVTEHMKWRGTRQPRRHLFHSSDWPLELPVTLQQCCDWLMSQRLLYSHWIVLKMQCRGRRGWILFWSERLGSLCFRQHGRPESASVTVFIVCLHGMFICLFITGGFLGHFCL